MKIKITPWLVWGIMILAFLVLISLCVLFSTLSRRWQILIALILGIPIIITGIVFEVLDKRANNKTKSQLLEIGKLIFADQTDDFDRFYNLYLNNPKQFLVQNISLFKSGENFDLKNLKPIEVLYLFASDKNLVHLTDWKGEENEGEIEGFISLLLNQTPIWVNSSKLRLNSNENKHHDGKFVLKLFKAIDKDLKTLSRRLLFFELGWDAYVYTVISSKIFDDIKNKSTRDFHGTNKLKV